MSTTTTDRRILADDTLPGEPGNVAWLVQRFDGLSQFGKECWIGEARFASQIEADQYARDRASADVHHEEDR
jgi:hypothetical protein